MDKRILPFLGALLLCGCLYSGYKKADEAVCEMAAHPFDVSPEVPTPTAMAPADKKSATIDASASLALGGETDIQTASFLQPPEDKGKVKQREAPIPSVIPGSETPRIVIDRDWTPAQRLAYIQTLYPPLPPLEDEPTALHGPNGHPFTLDDLQRMAAANSPTLRATAAGVVVAQGALWQAGTYANPTAGFQSSPSNDGSTAGVRGLFLDQTVTTGGKMKLAVCSAQQDLDNANLALKRARSDLSTQVRNAYFGLIVAKETVRVNKALVQFTDDVYRIIEGYLAAGAAGGGAPYEPAALRAQAYAARLAYRQAIQTYIYAWEALRAALALRELPLTEVAGRIDAFIPYYDYSVVLAHVLAHHTDLQVARNGIEKATYQLKLAQIQVIPNVDVQLVAEKEIVLPPFQWFYSVQFAMPIPIWDQNRGNILSAQGSLIQAQEEPHRVEAVLTGNLATAYGTYKNNLEALEYYRKYILPDQVRVYRGVFNRRSVDINASFYDLIGAQQTLAASVAQYLTTLGSLWSSVVSVADLLQTDDLFQLGKPMAVDPIPELLHRPPLPCSHPCAPTAAAPTPAPLVLPPLISTGSKSGSATASGTRARNVSPHTPETVAVSTSTALPPPMPGGALLTPARCGTDCQSVLPSALLPLAASPAGQPGPALDNLAGPALIPVNANPDTTLPDLLLLAPPPPVEPMDNGPELPSR